MNEFLWQGSMHILSGMYVHSIQMPRTIKRRGQQKHLARQWPGGGGGDVYTNLNNYNKQECRNSI
jgi:hypothetical protein